MQNYKTCMGKRLREERKRHHLTQEKIADMLDISVKHYSEVERGITGLSVENIIKVSDILYISTDYLLKGVNSQQENENLQKFFSTLTKKDKESLFNILISIEEYKKNS